MQAIHPQLKPTALTLAKKNFGDPELLSPKTNVYIKSLQPK